MVTPENGTLSFRGKSGKSYNLSIYSSDVLGAPVTMNLNGLAGTGSQNFYIIPEDCILEDVAIATGQTVSTVAVVQVNDANTGNIVSWANSVNTLANRVKPNIPLPRGVKFTMIQA